MVAGYLPRRCPSYHLDYKEIYGAKLKGEVEFNAVKTWIEYGNRLLGAFTGVLIFLTLLASIPYLRKGRPTLFYASLAAFILVGFQGWLGSKVVSTELHPLMVTLHMVVAIVIVFILLYVLTGASIQNSTARQRTISPGSKGLLVVVIVLSFAQVVLGTQVRESLDMVISRLGYAARPQWIANLGLTFYIHRSFSILVLLTNLLMYYRIRKAIPSSERLYQLALWVLILLFLEIATGVIMAYFAVPAFAQPIHLTLAILILGIQFVMWLSSTIQTKQKSISSNFAEAHS